jgi:hydroxymethylpyrimidine/phosphomethylpyrimidine kinase
MTDCERLQAKPAMTDCGDWCLSCGHLAGAADDLLYVNNEVFWYKSERINNPNTHGTGCTLSSAIACGLARGRSLPESTADAKGYVTAAIRAGLNLGKGRGPLRHF